MILREFGILAMFKLLFDLDLLIEGQFNLFLKCDGEEAHLLFKVLCEMDVSEFWMDIWLYILDSCELLILLSVWIVYVLYIIGGCDCDIILFPTFFS